MKRILTLASVLLLLLVLGVSGALATRTVIDIGTVPGYTAVESWRSGQIPGNSYNGSGNFSDVIGNRFATDQMTISDAPVVPFTIQIWTNNQPGGWIVSGINWGVADIAINANSSLAGYDDYTLLHFPGAQSRYDWGINMQTYAAGTPGQAGGGVNNAFAGPVTKWKTSFANVNPTGGLNYGGAYKGDTELAAFKQAPVETNIIDYDPVLTGNMSWVVNDATLNFDNNVPDYLITITFNTSAAAEFEYLWATARCANDVVHSPIPIPGSLVLLGSGLLGLVGWRRLGKE